MGSKAPSIAEQWFSRCRAICQLSHHGTAWRTVASRSSCKHNEHRDKQISQTVQRDTYSEILGKDGIVRIRMKRHEAVLKSANGMAALCPVDIISIDMLSSFMKFLQSHVNARWASLTLALSPYGCISPFFSFPNGQ